jgi:hypothetical protein
LKGKKNNGIDFILKEKIKGKWMREMVNRTDRG